MQPDKRYNYERKNQFGENKVTSPVNYSLEGDLGIIRINNPGKRTVFAVRLGIVEAINQAQQDASKSHSLLCEGRTFVAGADISEFGKPMQEPLLPEVIATVGSVEQAGSRRFAPWHGAGRRF